MKKILIPLAAIITLYSCKKSNISSVSPAKLLADSSILVSTVPTNPANSVLKVDKTYNLLGYGYDITGKYADTSAVRGQAINVDSYDVNNPGRFVIDASKTATSLIINAENAESYSEQLASRLAASRGLKQFKGSLTSPFTDALSSNFVYGNYAVIIQQKRVKMQNSFDLLKKYLTAAFIHDNQALSATELVKKYGTHVLSDITLGAKLSVIYQAKTSATDRLASESAGFRYAMNKVFGLSTGALDPINNVDLSTVSSPKLVYEAEGADQSLLKLTATSKIPTLNITNWRLSSTEVNAVFIDISENGLIPLYELIADPVKQSSVKEYITNYLTIQQVKLAN